MAANRVLQKDAKDTKRADEVGSCFEGEGGKRQTAKYGKYAKVWRERAQLRGDFPQAITGAGGG
jgi:hypothetical protein